MGAWALPCCSHPKCSPSPPLSPLSQTKGNGLQVVVWCLSKEADHTKRKGRRRSFEESQARCLIARLSDNRHPENPWATKHTRTELLEVIVLGWGWGTCLLRAQPPRPAQGF
ncbi:hypothetical protein QBC41DRAFT_319176, partial [Cercophora samala]